MIDSDIRQRWRFFLANAGYCTPPGRVACAMILARAESWGDAMEDHGCLTIEWVLDDMSWCVGCDHEQAEHLEVEGCIVRHHGDHVTSLWGIVAGNPSYRRVIRAELLAEAHDTMKEA